MLPKLSLIIKLSYITLKIKGKGRKEIIIGFFYSIDYRPDNVYINNEKQKINVNYYTFSEIENIEKLEWNNNINNFYSMFQGCSEIYDIDFSNFTPSKAIDMQRTFEGCSGLTSIDLSNFDTSEVTDMGWKFYGCKNLEYINLKNFKEDKLRNTISLFDYVPNNIVV